MEVGVEAQLICLLCVPTRMALAKDVSLLGYWCILVTEHPTQTAYTVKGYISSDKQLLDRAAPGLVNSATQQYH